MSRDRKSVDSLVKELEYEDIVIAAGESSRRKREQAKEEKMKKEEEEKQRKEEEEKMKKEEEEKRMKEEEEKQEQMKEAMFQAGESSRTKRGY